MTLPPGRTRRFHAAGSSCFRYKFRRRIQRTRIRDERNMTPNSLLIANRGEIAIRIIRAAAEMGIRTVAVFPDDDSTSLHTRKADEARRLSGAGAAAYLDGEQIIALAKEAGLRRDPSRLRLSQRERRLCAAMRRRGNHVRRTARRDARTVRRQGAGAARWPSDAACRSCAAPRARRASMKRGDFFRRWARALR